jgi:surface protein
MEDVFHGAIKFNGDISNWNTKNVTDMNRMFCDSTFNKDISKWNTKNVKTMQYMFADS